MKDNKGTTILLTVIGVATLLVAVVGATFAYFTATITPTNEDKETDILVDSTYVGNVTFDDGAVIDLCDANYADSTVTADGTANATCVIYPGAEETKTFSLTADPNSDMEIGYKVYMEVSKNGFVTADGLQYKLDIKSSTDGKTTFTMDDYKPMDITTAPAFTEGGTKVEIGNGILGTAGAIDEWTLSVRFKNNTGADQNQDQNKQFIGKIIVEADAYTTGSDGKTIVTTELATSATN